MNNCQQKMLHFVIASTLGAVTWAAEPVLHYSFDMPGEGTVKESISGSNDTVEGRYRYYEGVSGTALKPDGYTTRIIRSADTVPQLSGGFTIEAWVAEAAYPWNWAPVLAQRDGETKGFIFAVGARGDLALELAIDGNWHRCVSEPEMIPLREWTHVAATYDPATGATLYVNGKVAGKLELTGEVDWAPDVDMVAMMDSEKRKPSNIHRQFGTLPMSYSIDGPVDEIKLYNAVLSAEQITAAAKPPANIPSPATPLRKLPAGPEGAGRFGAYYTHLKYYPEWDDLWAVDNDPDVIVRFDQSPTRVVFWRGSRYSPAWVSENGLWMADQSVEAWNKTEGCYEHMQDRRCRYSHVRIIESNDARVVVHWRYAPVCAENVLWREDEKTTRACWIDEYYYIYPDQLGIRKPTWKSGTLGGPRQFQETTPFTGPGQLQSDVVTIEFAHVANLKGETAQLSYVTEPDRKRPVPSELVIQQHQFRSQNKPSIIFEPGNNMKYVFDRKLSSRGLDIPGSCNHWPVGQAACDGRTVQAADRPTSFLGFPISYPPVNEEDGRMWWSGLYGMTEMDIQELVFVGRSWSHAPELTIATDGFESHGYDRSQRAYTLTKAEPGSQGNLELMLDASEESPVFNPAFVIEGWSPDSLTLSIDGETLEQGPDFRVGHRHTADGTDVILWLKASATKPTKMVFAQ